MRALSAAMALGVALCAPVAVAAQSDQTLQRGLAVFNDYCVHCHGLEPHNRGATDRLDERYEGVLPGALEERTDMTFDYVKTFVRTDAGMAAYRPTEIPDSDLEALVAYLTRNNDE